MTCPATSKNNHLLLFVNGKKIVDENPNPELSLLTYLRRKLGICGTKLGCGEGGCGACTVMVSFKDPFTCQLEHISVNACLRPLVSLHAMAITTVEGIGSTKTSLHAIQEKMANSHGSQCGFCTPGMVMSMYTLLRNKREKPSYKELETAFEGNLCRCTGYRPILEGFQSLCCKEKNKCCGNKKTEDFISATKIELTHETQEPIFPPELQLIDFFSDSLTFKSETCTWFRPSTLNELLTLKAKYPEAKILFGGTELAIEMKVRREPYHVIIHPIQIKELHDVTNSEKGITFGAGITLTNLEKIIRNLTETKSQLGVFHEILEMLRWFAGLQIRNVATIGGNIMTGSPISDLNPIFMASRCILTITSIQNGKREIPFDEYFYTGYRKNVLEPFEILLGLTIPFTKETQHFVAFKMSRRRSDDIAIVNSAFFFEVGQNERISKVRIAYGGMAPTTIMPLQTMNALLGKEWKKETFSDVLSLLAEEVYLKPGVPGSMERYRVSLTLSFLHKAYLVISERMGKVLESKEKSATSRFHKNLTIKNHHYMNISEKNFKSVGLPLKHVAADKQSSGEAIYIDDIPHYENEYYGAFVLSTKAHACITNIEFSEALSQPGIIDFISAKDLKPERNKYRVTIVEDEKVFADDKVICVGQIIGLIIGKTQELAQRAVKKVKIDYRELPAIITMEEAIHAKSFHKCFNEFIKCGDVEKAFESCDHVLEGDVRSGAQEHFYMETNACIVVPSDDDYIVYCSTQNLSETQKLGAHVLGISQNKIVCKVKRLGGGFGGKETRSACIALPLLVASHKHKVPMRSMLDRDEDMEISGFRHPCLAYYKVGFNSDGLVQALQVQLYINGGCTMDLSFSVAERAMLHCDNAYHIPNIKITTKVCKTNVSSNTAFRGFGGPQGMFIAERWIESIAHHLKICPSKIRERNLYREENTTFYGQSLMNCNLRRVWFECKKQSQFEDKHKEVLQFNASNKWKKRGISIIPTKFGIAFGAKFMNQGGALVHIYEDGSVLLSHGGVEMGQGLHTKTIQVASTVLNIPLSLINVIDTSTDKVPNTSPTAASASSDLYAMAVYKACQELSERLEPIRKSNPTLTWEQLIEKAYLERISLSATGFHIIPHLDMDWKLGKGSPYSYYTLGVGCSLVEIDTLTGDHSVLESNIVMDLGQSLNPAIDIGQIEGAFLQGYGMFMMEQLLHTPDGKLITKGPGAYKIPAFDDIPSLFNVSLLENSHNLRAIFSSKAVGEPPLFLASSVFFAVENAIRAARYDCGISSEFRLTAPATAEKIRILCEDEFTQRVPQNTSIYKPWGIQI